MNLADRLEALLPAKGAETKDEWIIASVAAELRHADARVDRMGERDPWQLAGLALGVGIVLGWLIAVVL